jgi:hypothetical protein
MPKAELVVASNTPRRFGLSPAQVALVLDEHLQTQRLDKGRQCGRLLPSAGVVKEEAGKRRAPILEDAHERTAREVGRDILLERKRQAPIPSIAARIVTSIPSICSRWSIADRDPPSRELRTAMRSRHSVAASARRWGSRRRCA